MDKFDRAIIAELKKNARASVSFIAQSVHLSRSSVSDRIRKLEIGLTPKRLNELTRQYVGKNVGKTVTQLIHERVMVAACRDLTFTTKSIQEVAFELGYEDASYFCRFFRRETGVSPKQFRNQMFAWI